MINSIPYFLGFIGLPADKLDSKRDDHQKKYQGFEVMRGYDKCASEMGQTVSKMSTQFTFLLRKNWNLYAGLIKKEVREDGKWGTDVSIFISRITSFGDLQVALPCLQRWVDRPTQIAIVHQTNRPHSQSQNFSINLGLGPLSENIYIP